MVKNSFRQELQKEITYRFTWSSLFVSAIFLFIVIFIVWNTQTYQLTSQASQFNQDFDTLVTESNQILETMNKGYLPKFLKNEVTEREVYTEYYQLSAGKSQKGDLILFTPQDKIVFSTNASLNGFTSMEGYLKTTIEANSHPEKITKIATNSDGSRYLLFLNKIVSQKKEVGYSVLGFKEGEFFADKKSGNLQYVIADQYDNVFSSNSDQFITGRLRKVDSATLDKGLFLLDGQLFLSRKRALASNITIYTYTVFLPLKVLALIIIFSVALITWLMIFQAKHLAKKIAEHNSTSIDRLVAETEKISSQNKTQIELHTGDEFEYLADKINQMLIELEHWHGQSLALEKENLQFERKMLESQFNPHFLYNTLENIRVTSQFDPQLSEQLIMSLNRVLHYSIDRGSEETILEEDVEVLEDFLKVNTIRFQHFSYELNFDGHLNKLKVPRLFLLPVIENSLKYGMRSRNDLHVAISVYQLEEKIVFQVTDNGTGFPEEVLQTIDFQIEHSNQTQHGLINSFRRLKLLYASAQLKVSNESGGVVQYIIRSDENV